MKPKPWTVAAAQMIFRPTITANVAHIVHTIHALAQTSADAVLFPECAVTGYNCDFTAIKRVDADRCKIFVEL